MTTYEEACPRNRGDRGPERLRSCQVWCESEPPEYTNQHLDQLHLLLQIDSGPAENGGDLAVIEPGSVIFHADRALLFVEPDLAHAIDFPGIVERRHFFLSGRRAVLEYYVQQGHCSPRGPKTGQQQ